MLVDTDVLVWYLRGNDKAAEVLRELDSFGISAVTYIELVQGMRSKDELRTLRRTLAQWGVDVRMIDEAVSARAVVYVEQHFHGHSLGLADALIAATAVEDGVALLTANDKHYRPISELAVEVFRPE